MQLINNMQWIAIPAGQVTLEAGGYLNAPQYEELVRQSGRRYAKWQADVNQKLTLTRSLAKQHATRNRSPMRRLVAFFHRTFPVTEKPGRPPEPHNPD